MINIHDIRSQFPILEQKIDGNSLIYFDNGATTQKPKTVIDAIINYYTTQNSNVHRGVHHLSQVATDYFEQSRSEVKSFINSGKECEIIFTKGTTDSINLVANGYSSILNDGDEIIISELEHHSNIVPWQMCCKKSGAKLKIINISETGELDMGQFKGALSKKTKLVAISHVSNTLGTINPISEIINEAKKFGAKVLVDGAQAASHIPIDVQELDVDFYCFSGHKIYGPTGVGVLYGKEEALNFLPPYQGGGEMIKEVYLQTSSYADIPHKFEAGTPNIAGVVAVKNAIEFIKNIGLQNIHDYESELLEYATDKMRSINGVKFYGTAKHKTGIISFNIKNIHPYDIGVIIDKMGVAIRTGNHCTQPIMDKYKIPGTARISFGVYNTKEEIDRCVESINKSIKMLS
tara:strand:- start:900 stop:2114 length:1215 start_codon:yes stop_codon:yes gene_type:complete